MDEQEQDTVDELLEEANNLPSQESSSEDVRPPKKKRKIDGDGKSKSKKKKKKSKKSSSSEDGYDVQMNAEEQTADSQRRKELKILMLKHPNLNISKVLEIATKVAQMSSEDVATYLESSKIEMGLQRPLANAENIVGLMAMIAQRYVCNSPDLFCRFIEDTQLVAAVDEFAPSLGETITGPLSILVRACGHMSDAHFGQTHFSNRSAKQ